MIGVPVEEAARSKVATPPAIARAPRAASTAGTKITTATSSMRSHKSSLRWDGGIKGLLKKMVTLSTREQGGEVRKRVEGELSSRKA